MIYLPQGRAQAGGAPMGPDFQSPAVIAGIVGGALMLLIIVVMFLARHILCVRPTAYKRTTGHGHI